MQKFVRSISREPYAPPDIWYVGRARAEGAHGDLDGGQRSSEVKWGKLSAMATIFGQYHIWSKEALMQAENDDDLDGGQRSSEVKWGKLSAMATIFGQKKR